MKKLITIAFSLAMTSCTSSDASSDNKEGIRLQSKFENTSSHKKRYDLSFLLKEIDDKNLTEMVYNLNYKNNDLKLSRIRIQKENDNFRKISFDDFPSFSVNGGYGNSKIMKDGSGSHDSFSISSGLNYNLDLSGERKLSKNISEINIKIALEENKNTQVNVLQNFLVSYWEVARIRKEIDFIKIERENYRLILDMIESRYINGMLNPVDVMAARQLLRDYDDQIMNLDVSYKHSLAKLSEFLDISIADQQIIFSNVDFSKHLSVPENLSLNVISNRPDIKISEYRLESELKSLDIQYKRFYPDISLGAALSSSSTYIDQLFSSPVRSLALSLSLPFIEWYKIDADVNLAKISVQEAQIDLRITILNALTDVNNLISSQSTAEKTKISKKASLDLAERRLNVAKSRFKVGYIDLESVLESEISFLSAKKALLSSEEAYYSSTVKVWLAIFGNSFILDKIN